MFILTGWSVEVWKSLPPDLRSVTSIDDFKSKLRHPNSNETRYPWKTASRPVKVDLILLVSLAKENEMFYL